MESFEFCSICFSTAHVIGFTVLSLHGSPSLLSFVFLSLRSLSISFRLFLSFCCPPTPSASLFSHPTFTLLLHLCPFSPFLSISMEKRLLKDHSIENIFRDYEICVHIAQCTLNMTSVFEQY